MPFLLLPYSLLGWPTSSSAGMMPPYGAQGELRRIPLLGTWVNTGSLVRLSTCASACSYLSCSARCSSPFCCSTHPILLQTTDMAPFLLGLGAGVLAGAVLALINGWARGL